jgi:outer membrane protein assembly factor BamB
MILQANFLLLALCGVTPADAWPAFRGDGTSLSAASLPTEWSDSQNIAWRAALPGYGQSSPVVAAEKVFATSVRGPEKQELLVSCFDLASGRSLWQHDSTGNPGVADSDYVSKGAPTPVADAERVYAWFESGNFIALDHQGREQWQRDLVAEYGPIKGNHGLGSSPALCRTAVVLLVDHDGPSYLVALDKATGRTLWKVDRPARVSWSSPIVCAPIVAGENVSEEIIVSSSGVVSAYAAADGKQLWELSKFEGNTVPSPTVAGHYLMIGSSDVGNNAAFLRDDKSATTAPRELWRTRAATTSFSSPLVYRDCVYLVNKAGVAFCLALDDGRVLWTERLGGSCWASPLGSENHVYFFGKSGTTTIVAAGPKLEKIATNELSIAEGRVYGVAAASGRLVLRVGKELICVATSPMAAHSKESK